MSRVRSKNNKSTELKLIQIFKENGITGWRRNYKVKGHPDFVFLDKKIAIFVDGCFWHGHDCRNTRPQITLNIGLKSENAIYSMTKRSHRYLSSGDGLLFGFGNVSLRKESGITFRKTCTVFEKYNPSDG